MLAIVTEQLREWGDAAAASDGEFSPSQTSPLPPIESEPKAEVFTGDIKALFENLKLRAEAGTAAKTHIGAQLRRDDSLLFFFLNMLHFGLCRGDEKVNQGSRQSSKACSGPAPGRVSCSC